MNRLNPLAPAGSLATFLLLLAVAGSSVAAQAEETPSETSNDSQQPKIRVGVLYKDTPTGKRHSDRIIEEGSKHPLANEGEKVTFVRLPYSKEDEGVGLLVDLIKNQSQRIVQSNDENASTNEPEDVPKDDLGYNGKIYKVDYVDIIIGPTESDVFVRALTRIRALQTKGELAEAPVPVVSALVAAKVGLTPNGWFFRTNVDAASRADTIYNYINKYWVRSIAVLYANSEFGRNAEQEFQQRLSPRQRKFYTSVLYDDTPPASDSLRRILDERPEAVGFFCEREDLVRIYRTIPEVNAGAMSYSPLVFTVIDARAVAEKVDEMDIYGVTIADTDGAGTEDDVEKLGVETAKIVMGELQAVIEERQDESESDGSGESESAFALDVTDLRKFRDRLATLLSRSEPNTSDGMMFTNLNNSSQRLVLHVTKEEHSSTPDIKTIEVDYTVNLLGKLWRKTGLIFGSYGGWPILCGIMILIASGVLGWVELTRLFQGTDNRVFGSGFFFLFTFAHFLIVMVLYVFLSETGTMRYSHWLAALALCVAPTALLRTTFFETPKGKALEESLRSETDYFERRRLCAYQLLRVLDWERLKSDGFVSARWLANTEKNQAKDGSKQTTATDGQLDKGDGTVSKLPGTGDQEVLRDHRRIVRLAVQHCKLDVEKRKEIKTLIERHLSNQKQDQRTKELRDFYEAELQKAMSAEGQLNVQIRFLFVLLSFDVDEMIRKKFLTKKQIAEYTNDLIENYAAEKDRRHWLLTNYIFEFPSWLRDLLGWTDSTRTAAGDEAKESTATPADKTEEKATPTDEPAPETVPPGPFGEATEEDSGDESKRRRPPK